jgi:hypothetical protein
MKRKLKLVVFVSHGSIREIRCHSNHPILFDRPIIHPSQKVKGQLWQIYLLQPSKNENNPPFSKVGTTRNRGGLGGFGNYCSGILEGCGRGLRSNRISRIPDGESLK